LINEWKTTKRFKFVIETSRLETPSLYRVGRKNGGIAKRSPREIDRRSIREWGQLSNSLSPVKIA
jgi:hypothetical protein